METAALSGENAAIPRRDQVLGDTWIWVGSWAAG
jgi:hypothetical protein